MTVELSESVTLQSGKVIPKGSIVTVSDDTMKVVYADGRSELGSYSKVNTPPLLLTDGAKEAGALPKVDYSSIENPPNVGPGKDFTLRQKQEALELNKAANGGVVKSDASGVELVRPQKSQRGVTPDPNEWQFDHVDPKSCGGTNCNSNLQILSRQENRTKSDN